MAQAGLPEDKLRQIRELRDALKLKMKLDECTEEHQRIERENHELMVELQRRKKQMQHAAVQTRLGAISRAKAQRLRATQQQVNECDALAKADALPIDSDLRNDSNDAWDNIWYQLKPVTLVEGHQGELCVRPARHDSQDGSAPDSLLAALSPAIQLRKYPIGKGRFRCAMLARPLNNTGSNTLDAPTPAPAHPSALQTGASLETGDHTLQLVRPRDAFTRRALDCEHIIKRYIFSGTALTLVKCDLAVAARAASLVASFNAAVRTAAGVGEESEAGDGGIVGSAVDLAKSAPQPWQLTPAPFANEAAAGKDTEVLVVMCEERLRGRFDKWINNSGHVSSWEGNPEGERASRTAQALSHFSIWYTWTHRGEVDAAPKPCNEPTAEASPSSNKPTANWVSGLVSGLSGLGLGRARERSQSAGSDAASPDAVSVSKPAPDICMLVDVQGVAQADGGSTGLPADHAKIRITDAALCSWGAHAGPDGDPAQFVYGETDMGRYAINAFLDAHVCGATCEALGITGFQPPL